MDNQELPEKSKPEALNVEGLNSFFEQLALSPVYNTLFRFIGKTEIRERKVNELLNLKADEADDEDGRPDLCDVSPTFGKLQSYCPALVMEGLDRGGFIRPGLSFETVELISKKVLGHFREGREACAQREFSAEYLRDVLSPLRADLSISIATLAPSPEVASALGLEDEYQRIGGLGADSWLTGFLFELLKRGQT